MRREMRVNPFDEIRNRVSCLDAGRYYGLTVSRSGTALCPWHGDRHPSLKLYEGIRGCYCFSCGHGGDVIELVSGILNISRAEAAKQINRDYGLGLTFAGGDNETVAQRAEREARLKQMERYRAFLLWLDEAQDTLCQVHRMGWEARAKLPEDMSEEEAAALRALPRVGYLLDVLGSGEIREILDVREGVKRLCDRHPKRSRRRKPSGAERS